MSVLSIVNPGAATVVQTHNLDSFDECKCLLHTTISCGAKKGSGCALAQPGRYPPIAAAYDVRRGHRACLATAQQRKGDAELAKLMLGIELGRGEIGQNYFSNVVAAGLGAPPHQAKEFGAGYCYIRAVEAVHRSRVARLLGPLPYCTDVLRVMKFCGRVTMKELDVVRVGEGRYHVVEASGRKGQSCDAGLIFVRMLAGVVAEDPNARIGAEPHECIGWLAGVGCVLPGTAVGDLKIALRTAVAQASGDDKKRLRSLAAVGDAALRLLTAVRVCADGESVEEYQCRVTAGQSGTKLAEVLSSSPLGKYVVTANGVSITSAKVGSTALEAVFGVIYLTLGMDGVSRLVGALGMN